MSNSRSFSLAAAAKLLLVAVMFALTLASCKPSDTASPKPDQLPYVSDVTEAQTQVCRTNMQTIANAIQAARARSGASDYGALIGGGVSTGSIPDLAAVPVCPSGGVYSLAEGNSGDNTTFKVTCSAPGHGTFQPGVDIH